MKNTEKNILENKTEINIETTNGCLELLKNSVTLFREVYQIRDALGFSKHRSRMVNADVDGYRTFRDNYLKLKNHLRVIISHTKEKGAEVTSADVERAQVLYNRLIQYRDRVVNFAESKGVEFSDEEVTDSELKTMEEEELPKSTTDNRSLKDMAEHTFLPEEVGAKDDFVRNVRGRLIDAIVAAGETPEYANNLLAKSLDKMPFNGRPKGEIAAEVNRVIRNIYKGLEKPTMPDEVKSPDTDLSGGVELVAPEGVSEVGDVGAGTDNSNHEEDTLVVSEPNLGKLHRERAEADDIKISGRNDIESDAIQKAIHRAKNKSRLAEAPTENADKAKHDGGGVFDLKTLQDKVSQLEKSAKNAQFNLSERSEYLQLKELVKKIEILDGRISNGGLDWESDEKIRAFRLKTTNEQITFLQAQTDGLLQILNDKINQKFESFKNHFGDVMVELRNSMPELDTDFSKLETEPKIENKTGWWDKDFQKDHSVEQKTANKDFEPADEKNAHATDLIDGEKGTSTEENNSSESFILTQEMGVDAGISEPDSSPETGVVDVEKLKNNYRSSREKLHALNAELIALDKALAENMALPEEDWVLQKRKGIWLQMDLKDLESIQTKRTYLKNYKKLVESLPTETELPTNPTVEFEKASLERRLAWENETTKKRFGLIKGIIKRRKTVGTTAGTVGIMLATALGNGEIPSGGKNNFDISGYSPNKISVGQALADSSEEMPIIVTNSDVGFVSHEAPQLRNIDLVADSLPAVMTPPEPVVPPTASLETIPGVAFSEPITQSGINNNTIFGDKNIQFGHDLGVELKSPEKISSDNLATLEKMESNRFLVEVPHDVYWNIMEGQTKAGELPFLAKINLKHKQEVIDLVRDRIDDDHQLRINLGFGQSSADQTYIGTEIDTGLLNELAMKVATEHGYLLPENTSTAVPDAISQSEIASVAKSQSIDLANTGGEKVRLESSPIIVTDDVAEQFKNNFPGGLEAYTRAFDSWVRAIEGFTDSEGGWFSNLFGGVHKSAITTLGEKTIAEVKNLSKLSKQELRAEAQALGLPVDKLRTSLMEFNKWVESEQIKVINSTDKFSKLITGAFVLEKLTPSPQGEKK